MHQIWYNLCKGLINILQRQYIYLLQYYGMPYLILFARYISIFIFIYIYVSHAMHVSPPLAYINISRAGEQQVDGYQLDKCLKEAKRYRI